MIVHYFSEEQAKSENVAFIVKHYTANDAIPLNGTEKIGKPVDVFEVGLINIPNIGDYQRVRYLERVQNGIANLLNDIFFGVEENQEQKKYLHDGFWNRKRLLRLLKCCRNNSNLNDDKVLDGFLKIESPKEPGLGWTFDKDAIKKQNTLVDQLSRWQELYDITRTQVEKLLEKCRDKVADNLNTGTWIEQQEREVEALRKKQSEEFWWGGADAIKSGDIIKVCHLVFAGEECVVYAKARPEIVKEFREKLKDLFVFYSTPAVDAEKKSPSAPRWKTEDGQMTNWPMILFWVNTNTFETGETNKVEIGWEPLPNMAFKYWADRDKRDQWLKENRPRFSLAQLEKMAESSHGLIGAFLSDIRKQSKS